MRFLLEPLLAPDELRELVSVLQDPAAPWIDGASTAGWHARDLSATTSSMGPRRCINSSRHGLRRC